MAVNVGELQSQHPEWNIVDAVEAPGGGVWAVGADGGVFALDGAPFLGSYTQLAPEQRQGERSFVRIERVGSGYRLISNRPGQTYEFGDLSTPQAPPPAPPPPAEPPPVDTDAETDEAVIRNILRPWGLESLAPSLLNRAAVVGPELAVEEIRDSPQYKARFPAMDALRKKGRAISESDYINYETQASELFRQFGLPTGFYDQPEDFAQFIGGDVSVRELGQRIEKASVAAFSSPPEVRQQLQQLYGVGPGGITAYFIDPDRALPELQKQMLASQVSAAGVRTGFGGLTREEAERLADLGLSPEQAQQGLGQLAGAQGLFEALPGTAEDDISREEQLAATFEGNADARMEIDQRQRRRQAQFGGGGGFAAGQGGVSGLG